MHCIHGGRRHNTFSVVLSYHRCLRLRVPLVWLALTASSSTSSAFASCPMPGTSFHTQPDRALFPAHFPSIPPLAVPPTAPTQGPIPCSARLPVLPACTWESSGANSTANSESGSIRERKGIRTLLRPYQAPRH